MWNLEACAVCFSTEGKLLDMDDWEQREDFNSVARLNTNVGDGLLSYLCVECSAYVKRCKRFQTKCQRANNLLQEMFNKKNQITHLDISSINREKLDLLPSLAYWRTGSCHYIETEFKWAENNEININKHSDVPVFSISIKSNFDFTLKNKLDSVEYLDNDEEDFETEPVNNCQSSPNYSEFETPIDNNEQSIIIYEVSSSDEDGFQDDVVNCDRDTVEAAPTEQAAGAGGSILDQQYANFYPLSDNQQKVVAEITKLSSNGPYRCSICNKGYHVKEQMEKHIRMYHQKYVNSSFYCELCSYYFKTEHLFKSHMSNRHLYKYVCTKCPEVSYDRLSAKQHYIKTHLPKDPMSHVTWYSMNRGWIRRGSRTITAASINRGNKKKVDPFIHDITKRLTEIFFIRTPLGHLEQYEVVNERQNSNNYVDARFKCELCFRGYNEVATFNNHLKKHDPKFSGPLMCDVCKLYFKNARKIYSHISNVHLIRYNCAKCKFVCYNTTTAHLHSRWHNNVTYSCTHCDMVFSKASTRLSHIRIRHPSTNICNICGHSFIGDVGLYCHRKKVHSKEELELSEQLSQQVSEEGELYCEDCKMHFASDEAFRIHLGSSNKHTAVNKSVHSVKRTQKKRKAGKLPSTRQARPSKVARTEQFTPIDCERCGKHLTNKMQAYQHYKLKHADPDSFQLCELCGFSTQYKASIKMHMRSHKKEQPYACQYCGKRFNMACNRDRHHRIHTGEKPYECSHCHRRFAVKSNMKLHIQTVHLKIPYPPWNKKNRKRRPKLELRDSKSPTKPKLFAMETQEEYPDALSTQDKEV